MNTDHAIAIIGLSARVPGANNLPEFWELVRDGQQTFRPLTTEELEAEGIAPHFYQQSDYIKATSRLEDIEHFDAGFFDIPAREALVLDPQHRLFLEGCWEALERAGYARSNAERSVGVFAGASMNAYWMRNLSARPEYATSAEGFQGLLGNEKDYLASRVAYKLNLHGPAVTVQTACSTSLAAIHMACQNLLLGECDMALAGGVSVKVPQNAGYLYQEGLPFSPDGRCRTFDAESQGTVFGSGMGVVLLKPLDQALADHDPIEAVILGSAYNNDGNRKVGFTAPSEAGQMRALKRALTFSEVAPESIGYVETHGTGTPLGDPIEIEAIQNAYGRSGECPCALGSVKANIGHLETAAGVVSMIKTVLSLQHRQIPPMAGFQRLNPHIDFEDSRFYVNDDLRDWPKGEAPRRAGVSSFGMGGTNVHMLLEEAPVVSAEPSNPLSSALSGAPSNRGVTHGLLPLSAKTGKSLEAMTSQLADWLEQNPETPLGEVAATLQEYREPFPLRRVVLADTIEQAITRLRQPEQQLTLKADSAREAVFLFPGAGTQYANMGRDLYREEPVFREALDRCAERFKPIIDEDIRDYLDVSDDQLDEAMEALQQAQRMFPAIFSVQYALAHLLIEWGIKPVGLLGHSHGEYVTACLSGVMTLETATTLVGKRALLIAETLPGTMLAVPLPKTEVEATAREYALSIAAENGASNTVLSGTPEAIAQAKTELESRLGQPLRSLHVQSALHSHLMEPIRERFLAEVARHELSPPDRPWISSITGERLPPERVTEPEYWAEHLCRTVKFQKACDTLLQTFPEAVFLDMGPNRVVGELLRDNHREQGARVIAFGRGVRQKLTDTDCLREGLAKLWLQGLTPDWSRIRNGAKLRPLPLPTYAFDRRRYWVDPPRGHQGAPNLEQALTALRSAPEQNEPADENTGGRPSLMVPYQAPSTDTEQQLVAIWNDFFGIDRIGVLDEFIELGGTSLLATEVNTAIKAATGVELRLSRFLELGHIQALARYVEEQRQQREEQLQREALAELEALEKL
ncbi:type I polyketide synthase [Marinimicrobium locisalis]|uniref:type I polyketide synthase n=1 Tax=Marinimicrobium locisalis TaxID=546022 RepID=UPI0032214EB3